MNKFNILSDSCGDVYVTKRGSKYYKKREVIFVLLIKFPSIIPLKLDLDIYRNRTPPMIEDIEIDLIDSKTNSLANTLWKSKVGLFMSVIRSSQYIYNNEEIDINYSLYFLDKE